MPTPNFLDHTPVPLAFGTSGLRGLVSDITDLEAYINVKGALRYLIEAGDIRAASPVVLAGDLRPSTDRIMAACARAIVDAGCDVENAGKIPTPALMLRSLSTRRAGVMVTGSHIPFDRNGIKLNRSTGEVLKSDEAGITREVERVRTAEYGQTASSSAFAPSGMLKRPCELPPVDSSAEDAYVLRYLSAFPSGALSGMRVLVYEHSAVGRDLVGRILRGLGAEVVSGGRSESFVPIDTENVTEELVRRLDGLVRDVGGARLDAVVSTDGDSDRPLLAAVLPASIGTPHRTAAIRFLPGDLAGLVVAEYLHADAVAVPITANDAIERRMRERSVPVRKTKVGSPHVVAALDELRAAGCYSRIVGWEANGGFLLGSPIARGALTMTALPTRDAMLPVVVHLVAAAESRQSLASLWARLPTRFGHAGLIDDVPVARSRDLLAHFVATGDPTEVEFGRSGNVIDRSRPDGEQMPLSEPRANVWIGRKNRLEQIFTRSLGFDEIVRLSTLDGVRLYFRNGDVAHIRPSGNAPQLRIYANSDSQARADQIVEFGLREPDGLLRQLQRAP